MKYPEDFINKIICGECLKVMPFIPDNSIDLVVTSPPYNIGIDYGVYKDNLLWREYYNWCERWLKEIYRIMKSDARFCLIHYLSLGQSDNRHAPLMKLNTMAEDIGFKHYGLAIWWDVSLSGLTSWGSWLSASAPYINSPFEGVLILYKNQWKKEKQGKTEINKEEFMESCSGIWKISPEHNRTHPAPFPIKMANRCIKLLSYENDMVLDPFVGWGTTAVAAKGLYRRYIGIDNNLDYCKMARRKVNSISGLLFRKERLND